ncbi:MAG: DEAD/DEAH box helicase [Promethearchaeota archaeon]|jgi:Fanconi anemia group M protein
MQIESIRYFNGPNIKKDTILYRHYQSNIAKSCKNKNSLVVLPTGLGKTIIGILLIAYSLKKYPKSKTVILAPTRPLVTQHKDSCERFLDIDSEKIISLTGRISPEKRIALFRNSKVIVSTPQVINNDLMRGRYDLTQVSLMIFDEAHKTKGKYSYNVISKEYINTCNDPLILGLTASPGKDYEHIQEITDNLHIENVVFRSYADDDVKEYIYDIETYINLVALPIKFLEISQVWQNLFTNFLKFFIDRNLINPYKKYYSKLDFLRITHDLTLSFRYEEGYLSEEEFIGNLFYHDPMIFDKIKENDIDVHSVYSYCSSCISLLHAKDLIETQDISLFKSFLERLEYKAEQGVLSAKRIINSKHFSLVKEIIEKEVLLDSTHPKINKIVSIIREELEEFKNKKIIIFTQFREMAEFLKKILQNEFQDQLLIEKFIGQSSKIDDQGYSQKVQTDILQKFREDTINILIATSVAEEGIDIPNVDAIIFYEPVPSEIRLIQRRGRTGRFAPGRCYILITDDTVDVPFYHVAKRKESSMKSVLTDYSQIQLSESLERKPISFLVEAIKNSSDLDVIKNFKQRRDREKELLANRSIEEILTQIDNFCNSQEYEKIKECGVTFYSDLKKWDLPDMREKILKLKGKKDRPKKERKQYLNKNVKALINIVKTYSENGKIDFKIFQDLATEEEIVDRKFFTHFNQACYLGYLKRSEGSVQLIMDYD